MTAPPKPIWNTFNFLIAVILLVEPLRLQQLTGSAQAEGVDTQGRIAYNAILVEIHEEVILRKLCKHLPARTLCVMGDRFGT
jgi:hypothetical protein